MISIQVVVYVYYNVGKLEYRVVHNNVDCGGDNFGTGVVLKLVRPAKVKSLKTGPSLVGVMRLVTGLSEGKERLQLRNVWST